MLHKLETLPRIRVLFLFIGGSYSIRCGFRYVFSLLKVHSIQQHHLLKVHSIQQHQLLKVHSIQQHQLLKVHIIQQHHLR